MLTNISILPNLLTASLTIISICFPFETSPTAGIALCPELSNSFEIFVAFNSSISFIISLAPSEANFLAIAAPNP